MQLSIKSLSLAALSSTAAVSNGVIADGKEAIDPPEEAVLTEDIAGKVVVGWVAKGLLLPEEAVVKVKVDSGALTSSMHAVNMERLTRKGKRWVGYDVPVVDADTGN